MTAPFELPIDADPHLAEDDWVVFTLGGERLATPIAAVDSISPPTPLVPVPHASPVLLGAGNLDGDILPIVDLGRVLGRAASAAAPDGRGDIVKLRAGRGRVGVRVDRVERIVRRGGRDAEAGITWIDAARLAAECLIAPRIAAGPMAAMGEVGEMAGPLPTGLVPDPFMVVEAAGEPVQLRRSTVLELLDEVTWTAFPRAPAALLGVGWLRGDAVPVLSLAAMLGAAPETEPGGFLAVALAGRRVLFGVGKVIGLRATAKARAIDPEELLPDELRQIILGFPAFEERTRPRGSLTPDATVPHLSFSIAGQEWALPISEVDRVIAAQSAIEMPRFAPGGDRSPLTGAIELRGQLIPVASLPSRCDGAPAVPTPDAYVILRGADGLGAIGVDRVNRVIGLRPGDVAPPPNDAAGPLVGVVARPEGTLLCIIAPDRLWGA